MVLGGFFQDYYSTVRWSTLQVGLLLAGKQLVERRRIRSPAMYKDKTRPRWRWPSRLTIFFAFACLLIFFPWKTCYCSSCQQTGHQWGASECVWVCCFALCVKSQSNSDQVQDPVLVSSSSFDPQVPRIHYQTRLFTQFMPTTTQHEPSMKYGLFWTDWSMYAV